MTRWWSPRRSLVFAICLAAPLLKAQQPGWETNFRQGVAAFEAGQYPEAAQLLTLALDQAQAFPPSDLRSARSRLALAAVYLTQGQFAPAESLYLEARNLLESSGAAGRPLLGRALDGLGQLRLEQGRWQEAENLLHPALAVCRETWGVTSRCSLTVLLHLGELCAAEDRTVEAESLFRQVIGSLRREPLLAPEFLPSSLENLANVYMAQRRYALAEPLLKESVELAARQGDASLGLADRLTGLAEFYREQHDLARAEPLLKKAFRIYETANDPHLAGALNALGLIALEEGKYAVAKEYFSQSVDLYRRVLGSQHVLVARVQAGLAQANLGENNYAEARSLILEAMATERRALGNYDSVLARLLMIAGNIEAQSHRASQAAAYYREAVDIYRRDLQTGHPDLADAEKQYSRFAKSLRK